MFGIGNCLPCEKILSQVDFAYNYVLFDVARVFLYFDLSLLFFLSNPIPNSRASLVYQPAILLMFRYCYFTKIDSTFNKIMEFSEKYMR